MSKKKEKTTIEKNKLSNSQVSAGEKVHIGDVYNIQTVEPGERENKKEDTTGSKRQSFFKFIGMVLFSMTLFGVSIKECNLINIEPETTTQNSLPSQNTEEKKEKSEEKKTTKTVPRKEKKIAVKKKRELRVMPQIKDDWSGLHSLAIGVFREHFQKSGVIILNENYKEVPDGQVFCEVRVIKEPVNLMTRKGFRIRFKLEVSILPKEKGIMNYSHVFDSDPFTIFREDETEITFQRWLNKLKPDLPVPKYF